jgi:hypothetical protein
MNLLYQPLQVSFLVKTVGLAIKCLCHAALGNEGPYLVVKVGGTAQYEYNIDAEFAFVGRNVKPSVLQVLIGSWKDDNNVVQKSKIM